MNLHYKFPPYFRIILLAAICAAFVFTSPRILVVQAKQPADQPPGKVSLCHKTGSLSNPYVFLTLSKNAVKNGHSGHTGDIFNVSSPEECTAEEEDLSASLPTLTVTPIPVDPIVTPEPSATPSPTPIYGPTNICHYTGDLTTPYEYIQVSDDETYLLHANHAGDVFDVTSADDCPTKLRKFSIDSSSKSSPKQ